MKVIDERLKQSLRDTMECEWCHRRGPVDVAHTFSRGAGQCDIACNLVALCRLCHSSNHSGHEPTMEQLASIAVKREVWRHRSNTSRKVWDVAVDGTVEQSL